MKCPWCNEPNMRTSETFKLPTIVYRTKKCRGCSTTFTSHEVLADDVVIPAEIRNIKHKRHNNPPESS